MGDPNRWHDYWWPVHVMGQQAVIGTDRDQHSPNEKTPEAAGVSSFSLASLGTTNYPHGDSDPGLLAENQTS
jgi:hypothetical protein